MTNVPDFLESIELNMQEDLEAVIMQGELIERLGFPE